MVNFILIMKMLNDSSSHASLAQLVERSSHKAKVDSSILSGGKAKKLFCFVLFWVGSGRFAQICFVLGQLHSTYPTHHIEPIQPIQPIKPTEPTETNTPFNAKDGMKSHHRALIVTSSPFQCYLLPDSPLGSNSFTHSLID